MNDTLPALNDSTVAVKHRGSLWKISADSTAEMQSITFTGKGSCTSFLTTGKKAVGRNFGNRELQSYQPDWIPGILIGCFIVLAWVQFFYPKRLRQILIAPFSKRHLSQLVREGDLFSERLTVGLGLIYLFIFPLLAYQVYDLLSGQKYGYLFSGMTVYAFITGGLLLFWTLKILLMKFLGGVFRTGQATDDYLMNNLLFNFLIGIVLLPLLVFVIYLKSVLLLKISLIITLLLFTLAFVRGFLIGISLSRFSYLFLFVYLCSLEILPLLVLMKLLRLYF